MIKPSAYLIQVKARQKRSGKYPVKVRIVHQRQYHDFRTGIDMTEEEFEQANSPRPKKIYRDSAQKLGQLKNRMTQALGEINNFTFQKFENAFFGTSRRSSELSAIFEEYIASIRNEGRIKTALSYQSAAKAFKVFAPKASIHDVNAKFLKSFHQLTGCMIDGQVLNFTAQPFDQLLQFGERHLSITGGGSPGFAGNDHRKVCRFGVRSQFPDGSHGEVLASGIVLTLITRADADELPEGGCFFGV